MTQHLVALGGGGLSDGTDEALDDHVLALAGRDLPRVCFVPTASGDNETYVETFMDGLDGRAARSVLRLFAREEPDLDAFLERQDVVYVGGGSTVNLLAVWRAHGLDRALRRAYERGVVMAGISAGANCWFSRCTTDSWLVGRADPLTDGLGWLSDGFCPHYRSEPERRPRLLELVADGFGDTYAVDDGCALHVVDDQVVGAVSARPDAQAFLVRRTDAGVVEQPLPRTTPGHGPTTPEPS